MELSSLGLLFKGVRTRSRVEDEGNDEHAGDNKKGSLISIAIADRQNPAEQRLHEADPGDADQVEC